MLVLLQILEIYLVFDLTFQISFTVSVKIKFMAMTKKTIITRKRIGSLLVIT